MFDMGFIAIIIAFFAVATGLVKACDRIIGQEEPAPMPAEQTVEEAAA